MQNIAHFGPKSQCFMSLFVLTVLLAERKSVNILLSTTVGWVWKRKYKYAWVYEWKNRTKKRERTRDTAFSLPQKQKQLLVRAAFLSLLFYQWPRKAQRMAGALDWQQWGCAWLTSGFVAHVTNVMTWSFESDLKNNRGWQMWASFFYQRALKDTYWLSDDLSCLPPRQINSQAVCMLLGLEGGGRNITAFNGEPFKTDFKMKV